MATTGHVTLTNKYGLHARPAAIFVELCNKFECDVEIIKDGNSVNGKNILDIMMLGAEPGSTLEITASGDDEKQAVDELVALVEGGFGE